jgi:hypothetical protein
MQLNLPIIVTYFARHMKHHPHHAQTFGDATVLGLASSYRNILNYDILITTYVLNTVL